MTLEESIRTCLNKYADFTGRASRSEFWWWMLFLFLSSSGAAVVSETLCSLFWVAAILPTVAVTARRLHDTDRSGWWQLIELVPLVGLVVMIVWCAAPPAGSTRFDAQASPVA